jgi:hypothetical protein
MTTQTVREQLRRQLDLLPDDVIVEIADFAAFILARREGKQTYVDWTDREWERLALSQFLRDADDVEYTLDDAQEVYSK